MVDFGTNLKTLGSAGAVPRLLGFFNIESGTAAVSTRPQSYCDCVDDRLGAQGDTCSECGRSPANFIRVPAGDGDGVYPVFSLEIGNGGETFGAIAVFDRGYGLIQRATETISREQLPRFSFTDLEAHEGLDLIRLGDLEGTPRIWFGDSSADVDGNKVVVDVSLSGAEGHVVFAAIKKTSQLKADRMRELAEIFPDQQQLAASFASGEAGTKAMVDAGYVDLSEDEYLPPYRVHALLVLKPESAALMSALEPGTVDWHKLRFQLMGDVQTSHVATREQETIWQNVLLEREVSRAAGDVSQAAELEMLLRIYSWLFQGVKFGNSDCREFLAKFRYVPSGEELAQLGSWRWQQFSENFKQPSESIAPKPSLTKSPLTKSSLSKSNFCPSCGNQLGSLDKFCGGCGNSAS
jgi:hypothetical protein